MFVVTTTVSVIPASFAEYDVYFDVRLQLGSNIIRDLKKFMMLYYIGSYFFHSHLSLEYSFKLFVDVTLFYLIIWRFIGDLEFEVHDGIRLSIPRSSYLHLSFIHNTGSSFAINFTGEIGYSPCIWWSYSCDLISVTISTTRSNFETIPPYQIHENSPRNEVYQLFKIWW